MRNVNIKFCSFGALLLYTIFFILLSVVLNFTDEEVEKLVILQKISIMILFISVPICYLYNVLLVWKDIKINRLNIIKFLFSPWMFLPQAFLGTFIILSIYPRPMETGIFDRFLFFQGSADMGGELTFVATIALYVLFGFTASWYAVLKLEELERKTSFFKMIIYLVRVLKYHILTFILWYMISSDYDAWIIPNDFRNMFLWMSLLYLLTVILIVVMQKLDIPKSIKFLLAPIFIVLWLYIGSDGNTARANQIPMRGDNPHYVVTSKKHAVMIAWHNLCDNFFGDPKPHYTHQYKP